MDPEIWARKVDKTIVTGNNGRGRPRKTWLQCIKKDLAVKGLDASLVHNRNAWRRASHSKSRSGRDNGVMQPSDTGTKHIKPWSKYVNIFDMHTKTMVWPTLQRMCWVN